MSRAQIRVLRLLAADRARWLPRRWRRSAIAMERLGLVEYDGGDEWLLTPAGAKAKRGTRL